MDFWKTDLEAIVFQSEVFINWIIIIILLYSQSRYIIIQHTLGNPSDDDDSDDVDALAFHLVDVSDEKKDGLLWCVREEVVGRFTDLVRCVTSVCFFRSGSITLWHFSLLLGFLLDLRLPLSTSPSLQKIWFSRKPLIKNCQ